MRGSELVWVRHMFGWRGAELRKNLFPGGERYEAILERVQMQIEPVQLKRS